MQLLPERGEILPGADTGCNLTKYESGEPGMNKWATHNYGISGTLYEEFRADTQLELKATVRYSYCLPHPRRNFRADKRARARVR